MHNTADVLRIDDLTTGYLGADVVRNLSLNVRGGEVVALFGPNGAGKTTTLRAVSGLNPIRGGRIEIGGISIQGQRAHEIARLGVAHVPEDRSLFYQLTVGENLRLGRMRAGDDPSVAFDYFPALRPLVNRKAGLLSGGEQQMLSLARALIGGPKLLMVDEMSLGLAPVIVERLLPVVRAFAEATQAAVLIVEQHVKLALQFADRAYVLAHGDLVLHDEASRLRANHHMLESAYLGQKLHLTETVG